MTRDEVEKACKAFGLKPAKITDDNMAAVYNFMADHRIASALTGSVYVSKADSTMLSIDYVSQLNVRPDTNSYSFLPVDVKNKDRMVAICSGDAEKVAEANRDAATAYDIAASIPTQDKKGRDYSGLRMIEMSLERLQALRDQAVTLVDSIAANQERAAALGKKNSKSAAEKLAKVEAKIQATESVIEKDEALRTVTQALVNERRQEKMAELAREAAKVAAKKAAKEATKSKSSSSRVSSKKAKTSKSTKAKTSSKLFADPEFEY